MGTNFYAVPKVTETDQAVLEKFKLEAPMLHIGKSSGRWRFVFHATDECKSFDEWIRFIVDGEYKIVTEYGQEISLDDFKKRVVESQNNKAHFRSDTEEWIDKDGFLFWDFDFC